METTSLFVQICIIYCGLYYQAGKNDDFIQTDGVMYSILLLVLIASILFVATFIFRMRLEMMKSTVKKSNFCFKILSCGRIKDKQAFIEDNKLNVLAQGEMTMTELKEVDGHKIEKKDKDIDEDSQMESSG